VGHPELKAGEWIEVAVRDNGTGMPPEIVAHVFEPLFTTKGEGSGTGFGLAMAHGFVHQSGGFLTLSSVVGHGTTFSIFLPVNGNMLSHDTAALAQQSPLPVSWMGGQGNEP
jgi:signal transduction histidine kinase